MDILQDALDNHFTDIKHDVYILDDIGNIIATNDHDNKGYNDIVENLPKEREYNTPVLFSKVKNQPLAYYQMKSPNWTIVVKTTPNVTKKQLMFQGLESFFPLFLQHFLYLRQLEFTPTIFI